MSNLKRTLKEGSMALKEAQQIIHSNNVIKEAAKLPWPECIRKMKEEGNDQESAEKICGSIKAKNS